LLAGCASESANDNAGESQSVTIGATPAPVQAADQSAGKVAVPQRPLQCARYARTHSGIPIFGDAYTWWNKAAGKYERGKSPKEGAVMVLVGYAGRNRAHVAVVHEILGMREITVDHANWLDDGKIYLQDPVLDVSARNDWSKVRFWNIHAQAWGSRTYHVRGFIGPGSGEAMTASNPSQVLALN
jgi:surface antigen